MKISLPKKTLALATLVLVGSAVMLTGCGSQTSSGSSSDTKQTETAKGKHKNEAITLSPSSSAEVTYFGQKAKLTATKITVDYFPDEEAKKDKSLTYFDVNDSGKQHIRVDFAIENTGKKDFSYSDARFYMKDSSKAYIGFNYTFMSLANSGVLNNVDSIPAGETIKGSVYFEVNKADTFDTLELFFESNDSDGAVKTKIPMVKG